jgi:hypothetical protein
LSISGLGEFVPDESLRLKTQLSSPPAQPTVGAARQKHGFLQPVGVARRTTSALREAREAKEREEREREEEQKKMRNKELHRQAMQAARERGVLVQPQQQQQQQQQQHQQQQKQQQQQRGATSTPSPASAPESLSMSTAVSSGHAKLAAKYFPSAASRSDAKRRQAQASGWYPPLPQQPPPTHDPDEPVIGTYFTLHLDRTPARLDDYL